MENDASVLNKFDLAKWRDFVAGNAKEESGRECDQAKCSHAVRLQIHSTA